MILKSDVSVQFTLWLNSKFFFKSPKVISVDELKNDEEYAEILEDMREESGKFGK